MAHSLRLAVDHVGFTVPDLDQAITFFTEAYACEEIFRAGPYSDCGFYWPGEDQPEAATVRLAMLRHGGTQNIELLEYKNRSRGHRPAAPRPTERGGTHLAFYVDDIDAVVEGLRQRDDLRFLGVVEREQGGPIDGLEWVYLLTSWGLVIELLRWEPGHLPYEAGTAARLIPPPWLRGDAPRQAGLHQSATPRAGEATATETS